jgi:alkanesulfonate monooxygenase SsuD/methylene tetrahydromethanopterin reductase-like flavin-dependent oxidoreductase (luciferase family)
MDVGICFHREEGARTVTERALQAEALGFNEFWVIEDCFYTSGPTLAAAALTATEEITVGIGIMPVVARNAAVTAMELATLAALAPGRFHGGLGHGVQSWMEQMNERVASPLTALEETFDAVRRLLDGETVSVEGRYVTLRDVALDAPPSPRPLLSAGVRGPKSMEVSSRCADGVILADFVSADYVRAVREQLGAGDQRITVFASLDLAADRNELADHRAGIAHFMAGVAADAPISLRTAPFWSELEASAASVGWYDAIVAMPNEWWSMISGVGVAEDVIAYVASLREAGADAVAFFPDPFEPTEATARAGEVLLPLLR